MKKEINQKENPPRVSRRDGTHEGSRGVGPTWKRRYAVDDDGGDLIECSGKYCRSCTAGLIADCVALCCCPCAVVNLLTLAFVKVPWKVGRRCFGLAKKLEKKRKCKKSESDYDDVVEEIRNGSLKEIACVFGEEEEMKSVSARFEAEKVWLELYQVGHLGFGRVSFTGN